MSALLRLTATETRLFLRDPMSLIMGLALPPVLLIVLGAIPSFRESNEALGGLRTIDLYAPIIVTIAITTLALTVVPQQFATYRDKGILRRMRTTPVRPAVMLGAQLLMSALMSISTIVVVLAIARLAFEVPLPRHLLAHVIALALTASAMLAVGLLVTSLASSGPSASAIGFVLFFPFMFFAGLWMPRESMTGVLRAISDFTPLGAGVQSLQDTAAGDWPQLLHIVVMLAWAIVAGGLAARYFRWE